MSELKKQYLVSLENLAIAQKQFDTASSEYVEPAIMYWRFCEKRAMQLKVEIEKELQQAPIQEEKPSTGKVFFSSILSWMKQKANKKEGD